MGGADLSRTEPQACLPLQNMGKWKTVQLLCNIVEKRKTGKWHVTENLNLLPLEYQLQHSFYYVEQEYRPESKQMFPYVDCQ